jgi:hypothetical protein
MKIECITAKAQPTPKAKPRKNPMMDPHAKVTVCRMARHAGFLNPSECLTGVVGPAEELLTCCVRGSLKRYMRWFPLVPQTARWLS